MGKAMALRFAREGCDIAVVDLQLEGAKKVAAEVTAGGRKAIAIKADISKSKDVKSMIEESIRAFGKIDVLVNNAGAAGGGSLETSDEDEWDYVLSLNLKGAFLACKAAVPHMKKQGYGKLIFISSMGAVRPSVSVLAYHSAKAGIIGLTRNLAFELAPFNIYANCIVPGPIETPFWDPLSKGMSAGQKKAFFAALAKKEVPLGRMGTPEDIAGPALFFASELSSYVTGQVMCVAGGQPMLTMESTFISSDESKQFRQNG
jgi:NAD(P)-dependent dehydrogenase (short-subunit alcohol dehydrogenase family)